MEEEHQEQKTSAEDKYCQSNNSGISIHVPTQGITARIPPKRGSLRSRYHWEPTQWTTKSQQNDQPSRHSRRVIARPTTSPSGQNGNGQAEPAVEMSEEEAVCTFCNCILKVGKVMFKRKCNCQRDPPILAHESCTNNNHQSNEPCSQCKEPFQNIRMTLHQAPAAGRKKGFAWFGGKSN
ncbi:hypothetical protein LguiB_012594 [Lonicera macranthoides]